MSSFTFSIIRGDIIKNYQIANYIERIYQNKHTPFLDPNEQKQVINRLKKNTYFIYSPYPSSEKKIIYTKQEPEIKLYEVITPHKLRHQDILGSLFSINLDPHTYGDIIIKDNHYYIYILKENANYLKTYLNKIGNNSIYLEERNINELENYQPILEEKTTIVTSLRIDQIISRITNLSRKEVIIKIKNKEVILNYQILTNQSTTLKEKDIFSIRRHGKYQFKFIITKTKKDNYLISYYKY